MLSTELAGRHCTTFSADIGADANLMDTTPLERIEANGVQISLAPLTPPRRFDFALDPKHGSSSILLCDQAVTLNVDIQVFRGTSLKVWRTRWLVSTQRAPEPLLSSPLLEYLGLNTTEIFTTAADNSGCVIDAQYLFDVRTTVGAGRLSRVLDAVFHANDDGDHDSLDEYSTYQNGQWCDLGPESDQKWEKIWNTV